MGIKSPHNFFTEQDFFWYLCFSLRLTVFLSPFPQEEVREEGEEEDHHQHMTRIPQGIQAIKKIQNYFKTQKKYLDVCLLLHKQTKYFCLPEILIKKTLNDEFDNYDIDFHLYYDDANRNDYC